MKLEGKTAIITGGGGGLGEAICLALAREGADVVVSDLKLDQAKKVADQVTGLGQRALAVQTDVRSPEEVQALIDDTLKQMSRIDILICGAGVIGLEHWRKSDGPPTLEATSIEDWDLTIDVNLKGVFLCLRAIAPYFKKQKSGKIVNIASISGRQGLNILAHYCASKAGVINLNQSAAMQLSPYGVNVNAVCPGYIWTPMWDTIGQMVAETHEEYKGMASQDVFKEFVGQTALGRTATPEEIAEVTLYLVSDEAKKITGQAINVDGGVRYN